MRNAAVKNFKVPKKSLGDLKADVAAKLIVASADVALVVDSDGIILDLALDSEDLSKDGTDSWVGRRWIDTVTIESRPKVEELMSSARESAAPHWRQVNHPSPRGRDVPVRYAAVDTGHKGTIVAVGRNLAAMSALQQRIVEAQRQMEAEYARLRQAETRYRALFHSTTEAVLIIEAATLKVVEVNPAAAQIVGRDIRKLTGRYLPELFVPKSATELQALLVDVRSSTQVVPRHVRVTDHTVDLAVSASMFRQDGSTYIIVRLSPLVGTQGVGALATAGIDKTLEAMPDAFVVTDKSGRIQTVNGAFLELIQLATKDQARGQPLDRWVGQTSVDVGVLLSNLRDHQSVRRFQSVVRGEFGTLEDVEISAVSAIGSDPPAIGIVLRPAKAIERPVPAANAIALSRSVEQMTDLVGRKPLRELVRETTDIMERMCIEAALNLTKDNRASAAEMLGLSRQGLYMKLRRYGMGDLGPEPQDH